MSTVAKAGITLTSVSDAYSVSLAPSVCVIHADFDGSNPVLTNAYTVISVYCGEAKVPFGVISMRPSSTDIQLACVKWNNNTYRLSITNLASHVSGGHIVLTLITGNNVELIANFQFTVERESTMLDWIQAWESNKTMIGATSIITPKLFVGKKITGSYDTLAEVPGLTGVYIGPSENDSCGLYGYKNSIEIFHLDETGGKIGGWDLSQDGLYSSNGKLRILSDGSIRAVNDEFDAIWEILSDGSANFSLGNVKFYANGDAEFKGKITSSEGQIASWTITDNQLHCIPIALSAVGNYIAVANIVSYPLLEDGTWDGNHFSWVRECGGVAMYYTSASNFGFVAYSKVDTQVFSAGSTNCIASWNFDENALWIGTKNNNANQYTDGAGSLTIGSEGLRGHTWYINANGTASFVKGLVTFGETYGNIAGWVVNSLRLANDNIALISADAASGIYLTNSADGKFIERSPEAMENFIDDYGGIYLKVKADSTDFAAYDINGYRLFKVKSGGACYIAGWCFNNTTLYTGTQVTSGFTNNGHITLSPTGLRGYKWRLENDGTGALAGGNINWGADGSGQIAGGNISWDASGNVQFSHAVSLVWEQGTDAARLIANGKMLYRDPEFSNLLQYNGTHLYLNSYTSRSMVQDSSVPNSTRNAMRYTCTQWNAYSDWRLGGFYFANPSRPNGVYVVRIVAKIPSLWKIENYHNSYGTDGHTVWVTPQAGTDRYQEYVCIVTCGSSGNFDLINHFALIFNETEHYKAYTVKNSSSDLGIYYLIKSTGRIVQLTTVVWDVAYATVYDATAIEQFHTTIDANGIYTGTINAGQIIAGTIDATHISAETILSNGEAWSLKKDGSGYFANRHISWDADGNVRCNSGTFENVNISGNGDITGFVRKRATIITPLNINDYVFNGSGSKKRIDFMKTGSLIVFSNAIDSNGNEVDFSSIGYIVIEFPSCQYQTASDAEYYDAAMLYVGSTAIISISASNLSIRIDGVTQRKESEGYIDTIMTLDLPTISAEGRIIFMRCFGAPVNDPSTFTRGGGYAVAWSYNYVTSFKSNRCLTIQEDPWTLSKLPPSLVN